MISAIRSGSKRQDIEGKDCTSGRRVYPSIGRSAIGKSMGNSGCAFRKKVEGNFFQFRQPSDDQKRASEGGWVIS